MRAESGGASGAVAVRTAHALVASESRAMRAGGGLRGASRAISGARTCACSTGCRSTQRSKGSPARPPAALYALSMRMHMGPPRGPRRSSSPRSRCAIAPMHARIRSRTRPMRIEVADVLASPMVASPYRRLDCSLVSDGAAAVVVAHPSRAPRTERPRVRIAGSGAASDCPRLGDRVRPDRFDAKLRAARDAYAMAGVHAPADDLDCAEVYDAFSGAQIQAVEALGLVPEGAGGPACEAGEFGRDGPIAVNLSGGLLGQGGAPGATGVVQTLTVQRLLEGALLRGRAAPPHPPARCRRYPRRGMHECGGAGARSDGVRSEP